MTGNARDLLHFVCRALRSWPASLSAGSSLAGMWVASGALLALAQGGWLVAELDAPELPLAAREPRVSRVCSEEGCTPWGVRQRPWLALIAAVSSRSFSDGGPGGLGGDELEPVLLQLGRCPLGGWRRLGCVGALRLDAVGCSGRRDKQPGDLCAAPCRPRAGERDRTAPPRRPGRVPRHSRTYRIEHLRGTRLALFDAKLRHTAHC